MQNFVLKKGAQSSQFKSTIFKSTEGLTQKFSNAASTNNACFAQKNEKFFNFSAKKSVNFQQKKQVFQQNTFVLGFQQFQEQNLQKFSMKSFNMKKGNQKTVESFKPMKKIQNNKEYTQIFDEKFSKNYVAMTEALKKFQNYFNSNMMLPQNQLVPALAGGNSRFMLKNEVKSVKYFFSAEEKSAGAAATSSTSSKAADAFSQQTIKKQDNPLVAILKKYDYVNKTYPLRTRALTTGTIFVIADFLNQKIIGKKPWSEYDSMQTLNYGVQGLFFTGPMLYLWINKTLPRIIKNAVGQTLLHTFFFTPAFYVLFFFFGTLIDSKSISTSVQTVKDKLVPTLITDWSVWPLYNYCNFRFIPFDYKILFSTTGWFFWSIYLSFVQYSNKGKKSDENTTPTTTSSLAITTETK